MSTTTRRAAGIPVAPILVAACLALLIFTCIRVMHLRFARGDIYPRYSSLRHDPLGTSAYYESLDRLPGRHAERNMLPLVDRRPDTDDTVFLFGLRLWSELLNEKGTRSPTTDAATAVVGSGGRLLLSFAPSRMSSFLNSTNMWDLFADAPATNRVAGLDGTNSVPAEAEVVPTKRHTMSIGAWTGAELSISSFDGQFPRMAAATPYAIELELPASLPVYTDLCLTNLTEQWSVLYRVAGHPVVAERRAGRGTLAITTLSYIFSNEALRHNREPAFLAWAVGAHPNAIFDEWHLGVTPRDGVAALARGYGLTGAVVILLLLGILFVWQRSMPLVVHSATRVSGRRVTAGRSTHAGLVNLLMRSIPARDMLPTCLTHWHAAHSTRPPLTDDTTAAIDSDIAALRERKRPHPADIVATYNRIVQHLDTTHTHPPGRRS